MRIARLGFALGSSVAMLAMLTTSAATQRSPTAPPIINVYSRDGAVYSNYVEPAIEVEENAYVFAVSVDVDGQIQVLHPAAPGISVRLVSRQELQLPNFFAGFRDNRAVYSTYGGNGYDQNWSPSEDSRGTVIALASREPFNLEMLESGGDWNISEIRHLVEGRTPASAARALADYIGAKGEPIGRDWMRFSSAFRPGYLASSAYGCQLYSGYAFGGMGPAFASLYALNRVVSAHRGIAIAGYDGCGMPIFVPFTLVRSDIPGTRVPRQPGDTSRIPRTRVPHAPATGAFSSTSTELAPSRAPATGSETVPANRRERTKAWLDQLWETRGSKYAPAAGVSENRRTESASTGTTGVSSHRVEGSERVISEPVRTQREVVRQSSPPAPPATRVISSPPPPPPRAH